MADHKGHRVRLWERYRAQGFRAGFHHPHEKLELLLTLALPRCDTKPLAKRLLERFGSLNGVVTATTRQLCSVEGVGSKTAHLLRLLGETAVVLEEEKIRFGRFLSDIDEMKRYLRRELAFEEAEYLLVLFLDQQRRLIRAIRVFRGTVNQSVVYPREVVKEGLTCNAARAMIAHNHPSGLAEPSRQDIHLTHKVREALAMVDIFLEDHFIVGKNEVTSLRERGVFDRKRGTKAKA
ncbi:DNA repair protein RadC [Sulfidibacter corallicola]|uniref:DNA repair protein RadC n=1 Tax=Sulfidibacter corallicola TaxID=2818388 RepID=A0A8A4TWU0_SULCO|nr:DNA repair protein RadC [Sulfidibacter corallicola]QTD53658.1 DNA repair protein RadC [Sulfidibacter corallicola]